MARALLILGLLCSIFAAVFANQQIIHVAGRSGDVIIEPKEEVVDSSKLYFYYSQGTPVSTNGRILKDTEIADFTSFAVGGPSLESSDRADFVELLPFNKAHASVMFVAPGVTSDAFSIKGIRLGARKDLVAKYSLKNQFYPTDMVSRLTTIATGTSPQVHEITGRTWNAAHFGKTSAFKANALPQAASLAAKHAAHYEGQSIAISTSSDFAMAASMGFYPFDHHAANHLSYFYNADTEQVENMYDGSVLMTKDDIIDRVAVRQYKFKEAADTTRWLSNRKEIIVYIKSTQEFLKDRFNPEAEVKSIYNLNDKTDFAMFADFEIAFAIIEQLKTNPALQAAVKDHVHDLFTFVFPGIRAVVDKFGPTASHRFSTMYLLDAVATEIMEEISALYNDKVATSLLLLDMPAATAMNLKTELKETVFAAVKQNVASSQQLGEFFPALYAKDEQSVRPLCQAVKQTVGENYNVHCYDRDPVVFARMKADFDRALQLTNDDVATFQIVLWFAIVLVLAIFVVIYSIINMDIKMDAVMNRPAPSGAMKPHSN